MTITAPTYTSLHPNVSLKLCSEAEHKTRDAGLHRKSMQRCEWTWMHPNSLWAAQIEANTHQYFNLRRTFTPTAPRRFMFCNSWMYSGERKWTGRTGVLGDFWDQSESELPHKAQQKHTPHTCSWCVHCLLLTASVQPLHSWYTGCLGESSQINVNNKMCSLFHLYRYART